MHKQQGYILLEYALSIALTMSVTIILSHMITYELQRTTQSHSYSANMVNLYTSEHIISAYTQCKNAHISTTPSNVLTIQCPESEKYFSLYTQNNNLFVQEDQHQAKRILSNVTEWQLSSLTTNKLEIQTTVCAYPKHCITKKKTYHIQ